jgi:hypothetical protein
MRESHAVERGSQRRIPECQTYEDKADHTAQSIGDDIVDIGRPAVVEGKVGRQLRCFDRQAGQGT